MPKSELTNENFDLIQNGRKTAIEQWDKFNTKDHWTLIKDKDGIRLYKDANEL